MPVLNKTPLSDAAGGGGVTGAVPILELALVDWVGVETGVGVELILFLIQLAALYKPE